MPFQQQKNRSYKRSFLGYFLQFQQLHIEAEVHYIAVLNDIIFTF